MPASSRLSSLLTLEVFLVGGLTAGAFLSQRLLPWPVAAFAGFCLLRLLLTRRLSARTPLDLPIGLLLLMLPVTLWATPLPEVTIPQVWRLLDGVVLYYAIVNWGRAGRQRLRWLLRAAILAGLGVAATAPFSVTWNAFKVPFVPPGLYQRFHLLVADTVHPNVMGGYMALFVPLAAAWLFFGWRTLRWGERIAVALAGLGMAGVLVLSQSRGAWMGSALALGGLLMLRWGWRGAVAAFCAATAAVGGIATTIGWQQAWLLLSSTGLVSGFEGRMDIWSRAVYMLQDFPFTGIGMGTFGPVADLLYPFFRIESGQIVHAHNLFLQIGVDVGIPGLIAWLACWLGVMALGWRLYRCRQPLGRAVGAGVLLSQAAVGVHGIFDAVVWGLIRAAPLLWLVWGLAALAADLYLRPEAQEAGA